MSETDTTAAPLDVVELEMVRQGVPIWRPVPSRDGWLDASSLGEVRSWKVKGGRSGRRADEPTVLGGGVNAKGYRYIRDRLDGVNKSRLVSRLVTEAFYGASDLEVDHIDGDPLNNRVENLRYVTGSENCRDRKRPPRGVYIDKRNGSIYSRIQVNGRKINLGTFKTEEEAAAAFLAKYQEIYGCAHGERILPENHPARLLCDEATC
jgi:hypothetical protein